MTDLQYVLEKLLLWERIPVMIAGWNGEIVFSDQELMNVVAWWQQNPDLVEKTVSGLGERRFRIFVENDIYAYAAVLDRKAEACCMIGPVLMKRPFYGDIGGYRELRKVMNPGIHLPVSSMQKLIAFVQMLCFSVYGEQMEPGEFLKECSIEENRRGGEQRKLCRYEMRSAEDKIISLPYKTECQWLSALKEGKPVELNPLDIMAGAGEMAKSSRKQTEYMVVVAITLASRAAIKGGVSPTRALRLADLYLQKLERCADELCMQSVNAGAMEAFLSEVQKNGKGASREPSYIRACKDYIMSHCTEHISLEKMADKLKISYSYLSRKFKETEGMTIQQYIIREKLKAAADMISCSELSLTEIAFSLDFASQSHMGSRFKKQYGMTPGEYRKKYSY